MTEDPHETEPGVARVEALAYRSLRYVSQELRPFQILVGPNASGKSTFLDVVAFLGDLVKTDLDTAVRGEARLDIPQRAPDPLQLTWLRQGEAFEFAVELAVPPARAAHGAAGPRRIRYELRIEVGEDPHIAIENVWLLTNGRPEPRSTSAQRELFPAPALPPDHIVRLPRKRSPRGWRKIISRGSDQDRVTFLSETTGWNAPFALSSQKPALASLPDDARRFPSATWLRDTLAKGVQRLALSSEVMRLPAPPTRRKGYQPDGSNLPYVVARLEDEDPGRFDRWIEHVREALPDIERVTTAERPEDRHRYLVVRYRSGLEVPSWLVSDGTLRMLALTLLAYTRDVDGGIYLVEEPENGIHPRAVETVYQSLSSVYGTQVLLATHSPVILGMAELDDLLCFARDGSGATDIVAGQDHPQLRTWQGALDVSTLFAMGVLG